ncbi:YrhB domain-containing protein [Streptomyces sp. NPDC014864]|uniref:YrhB domain-containing protein n=1 Tax=Streptomyces sp. NPDC014864 TaxID=3364924 RepID=UPI0036FFFB96
MAESSAQPTRRVSGKPLRDSLGCGSDQPGAYGRHMPEQAEALRIAVTFLERSQRTTEPPLAIDAARVRVGHGLLIVPYNSVQYLTSRDPRDQLLDCWPILVDLETGHVRFGTLEERPLWKQASTLSAIVCLLRDSS